MPAETILRVALAAPLALAAAAASGQTAAPPNVIVPHRAVYDISLARSEDGSGVSSADGRMVFEITGNPCEGYKMRQRMVVNIGDEDGNVGRLDFRISTFESGDGDRYSFDSETSVNSDVIEAVEGEARRSEAGVEVTLKAPAEKIVQFGADTLFPGQHLNAILDAAQEERNFIAVNIYEGGGSGETRDAASAAIGDAVEGKKETPLGDDVRHWPVSVGYFGEEPREDALSEQTPTYQMQFTLYENGVTNDLVMDYGDYALSGSLEQIEPLDSEACSPR